ncbi:hypothetical protein GCM10022243_29950 [Saccharothrix violaceirubra]|uniref:Putative HAF family extracellular repeat protein n=1 Tax=Saccharothrix violaceirubra TaxID=413306 RepID=A0A7W7WWQ1_9PSEU|nr:hypothetical protein [Saccharothrix violaceirubra]MBB4966619.1 putative HAF family extracellular repeat protein [Saccharothrix violaceirubra]
MHLVRTITLATAVALAVPVVVATGASASVRITELPSLPGFTSSSVVGVNDAGQIIGTSYPSGGVSHAALWTGGRVVDLGTGNGRAISRNGKAVLTDLVRINGPYEHALRVWDAGVTTDISPSSVGFIAAPAINGGGSIPVAYSSSPFGYHLERAAVYRDGALRGLSLPASGPHLSLRGINDGGQVIGSWQAMFGNDRFVFRCEKDGVCARLPHPTGGTGESASALNESGVVVGNGRNADGQLALRWDGNGVTALPGGVAGVASGDQAVNERGDIVGWVRAGGTQKAALWRDGALVDLSRPGDDQSTAIAVNDRGQVIGTRSGGGRTRPFLWQNGVFTDLPDLGGASATPIALNNTGTVIGSAQDAGGRYVAVSWSVRVW